MYEAYNPLTIPHALKAKFVDHKKGDATMLVLPRPVPLRTTIFEVLV